MSCEVQLQENRDAKKKRVHNSSRKKRSPRDGIDKTEKRDKRSPRSKKVNVTPKSPRDTSGDCSDKPQRSVPGLSALPKDEIENWQNIIKTTKKEAPTLDQPREENNIDQPVPESSPLAGWENILKENEKKLTTETDATRGTLDRTSSVPSGFNRQITKISDADFNKQVSTSARELPKTHRSKIQFAHPSLSSSVGSDRISSWKTGSVSLNSTSMSRGYDPFLSPSNSGLSSRAVRQPGTNHAVTAKIDNRLMILEEILVTEQNYVTDLLTCINCYLDPLKIQLVEDRIKLDKAVKPRFVNKIFSNLEEIYNLHIELLGAINRPLELDALKNDAINNNNSPPGNLYSSFSTKTGEIFLERKTRLVEVYMTYCKNHPVALKLLADQKRKSSTLVDFLTKQQLQANNYSLQDFLIKPIQRICKYPLLFSQLLKETPDTDSDQQNIKQTVVELSQITDKINRAKEALANREKMMEVIKKLEGYQNKASLEEEDKELIKEGEITVQLPTSTTRQPCTVFLFSDSMICSKPKTVNKNKLRFLGEIPLKGTVLQEIKMNKASQLLLGKDNVPEYCFSIQNHDCGKHLQLQFPNDQKKREWFVAIETAIEKLNKGGSVLDEIGLDDEKQNGSLSPKGIVPVTKDVRTATDFAELEKQIKLLGTELEEEKKKRFEAEEKVKELEKIIESTKSQT